MLYFISNLIIMEVLKKWLIISLLGFIVLVILIIFFSGIRIVRPTNRGLVETFGKYTRFAEPGFH